MTDNATPSASEVAEDYRRQRQEADARKAGIVPAGKQAFTEWLDNNVGLLREIARQNGSAEQEIDSAVQSYVDSIRHHNGASDFDDLGGRVIVTRIVREIEKLCRESGVPILNGVVVGVTPVTGLDALQRPVLGTDASIIEVTTPFISFCNQVSRGIAGTLIHSPAVGGGWNVSSDPIAIAAKLSDSPTLVFEWTRLLAWCAAYGWITPFTPHAPLEEGPMVTRVLTLRAMELFAIAHEYGHHVMRHGVADSTSFGGDFFRDEHDADMFARLISSALSSGNPPNQFGYSGVGGVLILGMLELVARAKSMLRTGAETVPPRDHHPPFVDRIRHIAEADALLEPSLGSAMAAMRGDFCEIIEAIWKATKPGLQRFHEAGLRPEEDVADMTGWLPLSR